MATRRLNIRFIIILVVIIVAGGGVLYALRVVNKSRLTEGLYDQALAQYMSEDEQEREAAIDNFNKYLHNGKDPTKLNDSILKIAKYYQNNINKVNPQNVDAVHDIMQKALENDPENMEMKEGMAKAYTAMRKYDVAAKLYEQLSKADSQRPELLYALAENLIAANQTADAGFALATLTDKFSSFIRGYQLYATYTEQIMGRPDDAENIMDNMVESNLQSASAYARRSIYRMEHKNEEGAEKDLNAALAIDPEEADTIVAAVNFHIKRREFEEAHRYLDSVPSKEKDNEDISNLRIRLADAENRPDDAIALLAARLAKRDNFILRIQLFDRLVLTRKLDEAYKQVDHLKKMKMSMEMIGFFESAINIVEGNWREAARKLELSRSIFAMHPETVAFVDRQLALCYGKLGQIDKQIEAFQRSIENTPMNDILPISIAYILALNSSGKTALLDDAIKDLITKIGVTRFMEIPKLRSIRIALEIQKMSTLPTNMQDWPKIQRMLKESGVEEESPEAILLGVRLLLKQGKHDDARSFLKMAIASNPDFPGFVSYLALMEAQLKNYDLAISILDDEIKKRGPLPAMLIIKARIVAQMPPDKAAGMLQQLEAEAKQLTDQGAKVLVLKQLAPAWLAINDDLNAKRLFEELETMEQDNMATKIQLFDLARKMDDEKEMDRHLEKIRQIVGILAPEYRYCQATKLLWLFSKKRATASQLSEARAILRQAESSRGNWPNIPRALAELAILEKDYSAAIDHLYQVDRLGAMTTQQMELLIRLLYNQKRQDEIKIFMQNRSTADMSLESERQYLEAIPPDQALIKAKEIVAGSQKPGDYLWLGTLAVRANELRKAEECFEKVVELAPDNSMGWIALLQVKKQLNVSNERLNALIEQMCQSVPPQRLPLALAKGKEITGDAQAAETAYREAVAQAPNNLEVLFSISNFYLRTTMPELAEPHLMKMIEIITADHKADPKVRAEQMAWSRRSLADIYRMTPDYDRQQKALQLLDENLRNNPDSLEDKKVKGLVLAARTNPREQAMAIKLLEEVNISRLSPGEQFILANLYDVQSVSSDSRLQWEKCLNIMKDLNNLETVKNPEYLLSFIDMLLRRRQAISNIVPYLEKLEKLAPQTPATVALRARLMVQEGDPSGAERVLVAMVPKQITTENADQVRQLAGLLEQLGTPNSVDAAERVLVKFSNDLPKGAWDYSAFLGRAGRISVGLDLLEKHSEEFSRMEMMDAMCSMFRATKRRATPAEFARAEKIADACRAGISDDAGIGFLRAQFLEIQEDYNGAMRAYEDMLKNPNISDNLKAMIQNNLAYLLAMTGKDANRALKLVSEAIAAKGAQPELLDTQAVVLLKTNERANTDRAIEQLEKVILMQPEARFYFHLAQAYDLKDDRNSSKVAFEAAKKLDTNLSQNISKLEADEFSRLSKPR